MPLHKYVLLFYMKISLSEHFSYSKLIRFVLPSIIVMIFSSIYSIVDGLFVSNFAGKTPFAALNLIYPVFMIIGAIGFMMGSGGSAIVSKTLGEGNDELANKYFSFTVFITLAMGIFFVILGQIFIEDIAILLGADSNMLPHCVTYGRIMLVGLPAFMLQYLFQVFFVVAERPKLSLFVTSLAGITNIVLDYVFVGVLGHGLAGAALATILSQFIGGLLPLTYFLSKINDTKLHIVKFKFYGDFLLKAMTNGSSELMSNVAASIVTVIYNMQLMDIAGEDGVAAYGVIAYVSMIFAGIFLGYATGVSPIIAFKYGAQDTNELKNLFKKSLKITLIVGIVMTTGGILSANILASIFTGYDQALFELTRTGLQIFSINYLFCGFNIFGSAFFTALNNGLLSALVSFLRTLVFQIGVLLLLPIILGINGIWLSISVAEMLALCVTAFLLFKFRHRYHYI